jgi:hypothetical protein
MKANLTVEGFAFFELEIEGSTVPPTMNLIDSIFIHEGIGIAIPTLRLQLYDQKGTLYRDLNLSNMTKIIISMAKDRTVAEKKKFRFFGCRKETTHAGPMLTVDCILDIPKWSTGSYCEPFVGTSSDAIAGAAAAAGLRYDGPRVPPQDSMNWLNINQTRSAFSEDVAIRGYVAEGSAMCRVLLSNQTVRYRDLMDVLQQEPEIALLQNVPSSASGGKSSFNVRETKDGSLSGFFTHYVNFGWKVGVHSLDNGGQTIIDSYQAKLLGKAFPINEEVKAMIEGARVSYVADDPGTSPNAASNLHQYYEKAFYQNLRGLGLFSEKVSLLTDWVTGLQVLDSVEYKQHELQSYNFIDIPALSGRWLVAGKTLYIKNGHKYSEVFDLIRPFINELGSTSMTGGADKSAPAQQATANEGRFDLTGDKQASVESTTSKAIASQVGASNNVTGVEAATNTMVALKEFDAVNPPVPVIVSPSANGSWPTEVLQSQDNLRNAVNTLAGQANPDLPVIADGDLDGFKIIKKVSAPLLETLANIGNNPQEAVYLAQNLQDDYWIKTQAIERATSVGSDVTGIRLNSVVSAATGGYYSPGAIVGDVLGGGVWSADLANAGVPIPDVDLPIINQAAGFGGKLLFEATGVGLSGSNILIDPYKTASAIEAFASGTTPEQYLAQNGVTAFINTFGSLAPPEAQSALTNLAYLARDVMYRYSQNEVLTDSSITNSELINGGRDIAFLFGDPSVVPIVDRVTNVANMVNYTEIDTDRKLVTWAQYYALGATAVEAGVDTAEDAGVQWKFPFSFPSEAITPGPSTGNYPNYFDDKTQNWYNSKGTAVT